MAKDNCDNSLLTQEKLSLKSWGLPKSILEKYSAKGVENMFPWQVECLTCDGVLSGRNLVYSAPTSAGKTMVAEIITIQTVLEKKKKVIFILPFVSVVREKMLYFQNLLGSSGVRVEGFMGSHAPPGGLRTVHIAVCTIEKANSLINRLLEDQGLDAIGCVVVDELHLLGDPHRGYLLELLLTKLKYMCCRDKTLKIQIVGMSATLPNVGDLATWLDAALYTTQFRPIPLTEYLKINTAVYDVSTMELKYNVQPLAKFKTDSGDVIHLCLESLLAGHSVLVFCPTRGWCETSAQQIAAEFRRIGYEKSKMGLAVRNELDGAAISDVLEQLKRCPAGLDPALGRSVAFGVAFHHAGLTMDERDIVEGAFRNNVLRVLVATSTLSSGVNLPARRVLIRCPPRNMASDVRSYRQMVGRAGRMGKDTAGESFLICNGSERAVGEQLVTGQLPPVESSLGMGDMSFSLKRAVLEVIASGVVCKSEDVELYTNCTFLASTLANDSENSLVDPLAACVEYLQTNEFIRVSGSSMGPTPLGEACLSASLPPDQGLKLLKELHRARQCFVLETELHVIYQVTPYSVSDQWGQLDWLRVLSLWEDLPISMKRVGELVGVEERFLVRAVRGTVNMNDSAQKLSIHRRFYTALALQDLVNEVPLPQVAVKFACSKGVLQSLQQSASTFAGMVTQFTRRLGWSNVELLVSQFGARLQFGAQRELLDLLRLDCLTAVQARALYNSGIQALADLATASTGKVERALARATPFQSEQDGEEGGSDQCRIWLVGRCAATETQAADILVREARQYLERELGLQSANWGDLNTSVESFVSEKSLTPVVSTPLRPIGLDKAGTEQTNSPYSKNDNVEEKTNKELESTVRECEYEKSELARKFTKENEPKDSEAKVLGENIQCGTKTCENGKISPTICESKHITVVKKRGSLDLFDSPEPENRPNSGRQSDSAVNIEEVNIQLNSEMIKNFQTPKAVEVNQGICHKKSASNNNTNEISEAVEITKNNAASPKSFSSRAPRSSVEGTSSPMYECLEQNNSPVNDANVLFSSYSPKEDVYCLAVKLDANLGGESLLEMSSFVADTEECGSVKTQKTNLWDSNFEGNSLLLGISSCSARTGERKRKRSVGFMSDSKKIKVNVSRSDEQNKKNQPNELQVSKVTSTSKILNPVKSSTPVLSQYFEGSINLDSPFLLNENVGCARTNNDNFNDMFVDSNVVATNNVNTSSKNNCIGNDDECNSFELNLSSNSFQDQSSSDGNLKFNSKIFYELDSKNNTMDKNNFQSSSSSRMENIENDFDKSPWFDGSSMNLDSKLTKLLDVQTSVAHCKENEGKLVRDKKITVPELSTFKHDVNKCLFQDGVVDDSKANTVIDMQDIFIKKKTENIYDSSLFAGNVSLNSQLCGILDTGNYEKGKGYTTVSVRNNKKELDSSEFIFDTQTCNAMDNLVTNKNKANVEKNCLDKKSNWTESMEIKEIQNFTFDDETISGTPVNHQKSILFKKPKKNKTNSHQKTQSTNGKQHSGTKEVKALESTLYEKPEGLPIKIFKSEHLPFNEINEPNFHSPIRYDKGNGKEFPNESFIKSVELLKPNTANSSEICNSVTDSFLAAAFDSSFNMQSQKIQADEIKRTQQTPVTPQRKTVKERNQNIDSPTVNKNRSQVEVVTVNDAASRQDFRSNVDCCKCISLVLTTRAMEDIDGGGIIGAKIIRRRTEPTYPYCYQGVALSSVVVCWENSKVYIITLDQKYSSANLEVLKDMMSRRELVICSWEAKKVVRLLRQCCQLQCDTRISDPTVAEWLLKPHQPTPTLKQLARSYGVSAPQCSLESAFTALLVWEISLLLKTTLKQSGLYKSYTEVEMPIQLMLAEMEVEGVAWNREYTEQLWTATEEKMLNLQTALYTLAGRKFSLSSRTDLAKIKKIMKDSGEERLAEFNKILRNWRVLNSLKTRNMSGLLIQEDSCIRGRWETHSATGRISMQEPSLQHVPRDIVIDEQVFSLRSAFVAGPGNVLVSADFCQLELRLLAHFSQDTGLLEAFSRPGDVFTAIASEWHSIPQHKVGAELRQQTKQLCYGLIYGMGLGPLAEEMGIEEARAGDMVSSFHCSYPGLQVYMDRCVSSCRASPSPHVTTLLGRRRYLPDINSNSRALRGQAERQAVNTTIQGSAADIAKMAMLRVKKFQRHNNISSARLIIHLHDELIYEVAQKDLNEFVKILRKGMEEAVTLSVPLPVKVKKGPTWGQLELID